MTGPMKTAGWEGKTPWFSICTAPVRVGWYEVRYWSDRVRQWSCEMFRWWDGECWRFGPDLTQCDLGNPRDQWRGRAEP